MERDEYSHGHTWVLTDLVCDNCFQVVATYSDDPDVAGQHRPYIQYRLADTWPITTLCLVCERNEE